MLHHSSAVGRRCADVLRRALHRYVGAFAAFHSRDMPPNGTFYDIVISGGGLVGQTCALALSGLRNSGKRILLIDSGVEVVESQNQEKGSSWSNRVVAINPSSMELLRRVAIWKSIENGRCNTVKKMHISDASSDANIIFGDGFEPLCWIVENNAILSNLSASVKSATSISRQYSSQVVDVLSDSVGTLLSLSINKNGIADSPVWTKLLIVAEGPSSQLRNKLGFRTVKYDYSQRAIVTTLKLAQDSEIRNTTAWQRFLPSATIALLPLDEAHSSLVWSLPVDVANSHFQMSKDDFVSSLNNGLNGNCFRQTVVSDLVHQLKSLLHKKSIGLACPRVEAVVGERLSFPLKLLHALPVTTQHRVVLLGDSAHVIHPHVGLGLNLGLGDVAELVSAIEDSIHVGADIGSPDQLKRYRRSRLTKTLSVAVASHFLQRMYSSTFKPVVGLRSFGLTAIDAVPPLKNVIVSQASCL